MAPRGERCEGGTTVDRNDFDALTRSLSALPSRRAIVRGFVGAGLGGALGRLPQSTVARKRRKKVTLNAFGCVNVGDFCRNADQCCSGICEGKKGKKRCKGHGAQGCRPGIQDNTCDESGGTDVRCTTSTGDPNGVCGTTTGNAGYCLYSGGCYGCSKDVECQALCGPQAACIRCDDCLQDVGVSTSCATPDNVPCP
jgi:hypothetical protein